MKRIKPPDPRLFPLIRDWAPHLNEMIAMLPLSGAKNAREGALFLRYLYPISSPIKWPERADMISEVDPTFHGGAGFIANSDFKGTSMIVQEQAKGDFNAFRSHFRNLFFHSMPGLPVLNVELSQHSTISGCVFKDAGDCDAVTIRGDTSSIENCDFLMSYGSQNRAGSALVINSGRQIIVRDCTVHNAYAAFVLNNCIATRIENPETELTNVLVFLTHHSSNNKIVNAVCLHNETIAEVSRAKHSIQCEIDGMTEALPSIMVNGIVKGAPVKRASRRRNTFELEVGDYA